MCDIISSNNRIIKERFWVTDVSDSTRFSDILTQNSSSVYQDHPVKASVGLKQPEREPSNWSTVLLTQKVDLIRAQGGNYVRFTVTDKEGLAT